MFQTIRIPAKILPERVRTGMGRRATGIFLTLLVEGLLGLLLLTLAPSTSRHEEAEVSLLSFDAVPLSEEEPSPPAVSTQDRQSRERPAAPPPEPAQAKPSPDEQQPAPPFPSMIQLSQRQMAAADIATIPVRPAPPAPAAKSTVGPPNNGMPGDTPRVEGGGPHGEPLYAASWYRKPYDDELRGYLSTARGPGWGLIACRTVPDYRVEDCVPVAEYPQGSNIAHAVLAAAWQFRVRPPQLGGLPKVGEWVRIRIDYELRRSEGIPLNR